MRRSLSGAAMGALLVLAAACSSNVRVDPIQLEKNLVTVDNRSDHDWSDVQIWINRQFRATVPRIAKGQRFQAPMNLFVTGYGQRFNFSRMQITDVRVNAKRPDGTPFELRKQFEGDRLGDALKGVGGNR
jgi:hypothetical protein